METLITFDIFCGYRGKKIMAMHKNSFNVDVDDVLSESFSTLCDERGYTKYRAIEGALRAFIALPDELQVALMKSQNSDVYELLVHNLRDIELHKILQALTPEQRMVLIESAKVVTKRLFQKKKALK